MDKILKSYLDHAVDIIGPRSPSEIAHDDAVVDALRQGHSIKEALAIARAEFPHEAIEWNGDNIDDISAHYDYLKNHNDILRMIEAHTKSKRTSGFTVSRRTRLPVSSSLILDFIRNLQII